MQKKALGERFNPERYGMIFCPQCNGRGKVFKTVKEFEVCMACGGFVLIKTPREKQNSKAEEPDCLFRPYLIIMTRSPRGGGRVRGPFHGRHRKKDAYFRE
jgi:hypothetical protein